MPQRRLKKIPVIIITVAILMVLGTLRAYAEVDCNGIASGSPGYQQGSCPPSEEDKAIMGAEATRDAL